MLSILLAEVYMDMDFHTGVYSRIITYSGYIYSFNFTYVYWYQCGGSFWNEGFSYPLINNQILSNKPYIWKQQQQQDQQKQSPQGW